uniref:Uncharacterized protein n=1 Tax=viral metagenome TaxID=1070528 RepID=A0A6M3III9_9ZZZZ
MPVIAESEPLIFGGPSTPGPTQPPIQPPMITPTPYVPGTPLPTVSPSASSFVQRHEQFINTVDNEQACFKRTALASFSDQEFVDHITVAMKDKYITQEKDLFCSMKGIGVLSKALKRLGEE